MGEAGLAFNTGSEKAPAKKPYGPAERQELSFFRMKQINMKGNFEGEELRRFNELQDMETANKINLTPLNKKDHDRFLALSRLDKFEGTESEEHNELRKRLEAAGCEAGVLP